MTLIRSVYSRVIRNSDDLDKLVTSLGVTAGATAMVLVAWWMS